MQKTKPKMLKKQKQLEFFVFLISWLIISIQKNEVFFVFPFQKNKENNKLLSQNQTFSQKFVFLVLLLFF